MPDSITAAFVQEYKATTELLLQQKGSRFRKAVTTNSYRGKSGTVVEQYAATSAVKKTSRHSPTPNIDIPQSRPWVYPFDYEWGHSIDQTDTLRMLIDPTSPVTMSGAAAMARAQDDEIIAAFFGTAKVGENGSTSEVFDTAYDVGVNVGGTASSINVAKLQNALRLAMGAHKGEVEEMIYCGISSYEHDALLKEIQITSKDFNGGQPVLENGLVRRFMGANFLVSERLLISSGNRMIPFWVPTGMHMGLWQDLIVKVDQLPTQSYDWQVYMCETIGATRVQQGKVIRILCDDQI